MAGMEMISRDKDSEREQKKDDHDFERKSYVERKSVVI
jgi:hypothetical protein